MAKIFIRTKQWKRRERAVLTTSFPWRHCRLAPIGMKCGACFSLSGSLHIAQQPIQGVSYVK